MTPRPRRRAVGPAGATPVRHEPEVTRQEPEAPAADEDDDARLRADRPPHHDQGV